MTKQFVPSYTHHSRCLCGLLVWSVEATVNPGGNTPSVGNCGVCEIIAYMADHKV